MLGEAFEVSAQSEPISIPHQLEPQIHFAPTIPAFREAIAKSPENTTLLEDPEFDLNMLVTLPLCSINASSLESRTKHFFIQNEDGVIAAAISITESEDDVTLEHLARRPDEAGKGYAAALMRQVMAYTHNQDKILVASLYSAPDTEKCMQLYGRLSQEFPDLPIDYFTKNGPITVRDFGPYTVRRGLYGKAYGNDVNHDFLIKACILNVIITPADPAPTPAEPPAIPGQS